MAVAVIFGLSLATIMTLVVTPVMYHLNASWRGALVRAIGMVRRVYWAAFWLVVRDKPRLGEPGYRGAEAEPEAQGLPPVE